MRRQATALILTLVICGGGGSSSGNDASPTPLPEPLPTAPDASLAESGYQGYGAVTKGAKSSPNGYKDYVVTSLADSGPGTLRDAVSKSGRNITFSVAGTIKLKSTLQIRYSYLTIDGSSAPEPGITVVLKGSSGLEIEAGNSTGPCHDIIIHHLRIDGQAKKNTNVGDILGLDGETNPVYNIVLDHITGIASTDGVFDIYGEVRDVTISWCLILNTVTAMHVSERSGYPKSRERISFHHNVFYGNNERQVRFRHDSLMIDYVNNVIHGWGYFEGGAYGICVAHDKGEVNPSLNIEDNVFHVVDGNHGDGDDALRIEPGPDRNTVYFRGNILPDGERDNRSNGRRLAIPASAEVKHFPADTLDDNVVPFVGTQHPTSEELATRKKIRNNIP